MVNFSSILRAPLSFLGVRSSKEERMVAYVIREHDRGRSLAEILADSYVRNRCTPAEQSRLLDHPELIHAIGDDLIDAARGKLSST